MDSSLIEDNVYKMMVPMDHNNEDQFKFVQVKKKEIQTWFWKQKVIQLIDVSQKIMYEMALGEKRLFSLLNATVSHEMRNPTNSIQALVQDQ